MHSNFYYHHNETNKEMMLGDADAEEDYVPSTWKSFHKKKDMGMQTAELKIKNTHTQTDKKTASVKVRL